MPSVGVELCQWYEVGSYQKIFLLKGEVTPSALVKSQHDEEGALARACDIKATKKTIGTL